MLAMDGYRLLMEIHEAYYAIQVSSHIHSLAFLPRIAQGVLLNLARTHYLMASILLLNN